MLCVCAWLPPNSEQGFVHVRPGVGLVTSPRCLFLYISVCDSVTCMLRLNPSPPPGIFFLFLIELPDISITSLQTLLICFVFFNVKKIFFLYHNLVKSLFGLVFISSWKKNQSRLAGRGQKLGLRIYDNRVLWTFAIPGRCWEVQGKMTKLAQEAEGALGVAWR